MSLTQPHSQPDLSKSDFVTPVSNTGVVYVIVADRQKFDEINRPMTLHDPLPDGRRCLSKDIGNWSMASSDGLVIFQHWLAAPSRQPYERFPGGSSASSLSSLSIKNRDSAVSSAATATTSAAEAVAPSTESQIALAVTKRS